MAPGDSRFPSHGCGTLSFMNTVTISAAVSAIVTAVVGTIMNWGGGVVNWLRKTIPPNHAPMNQGAGYSNNRVGSVNNELRMLVCCAPNRSLRRKNINPDAAIRFAHTNFPKSFPPEPAYSSPGTGVRFDLPEQNDSAEGYAWVHSSGRLDLCLPVPTNSTDPHGVTLDLVDLTKPVLIMLRAVDHGSYDDVFGRRLPLIPRKFDFAIVVSTTISLGTQGQVSWKDVVFPGRRPPRAGTQQQAHCPSSGYATEQLRSWRMRRPSRELLCLFLTDFLEQNGFHDVGDAIDDTLRQLGPEMAR